MDRGDRSRVYRSGTGDVLLKGVRREVTAQGTEISLTVLTGKTTFQSSVRPFSYDRRRSSSERVSINFR